MRASRGMGAINPSKMPKKKVIARKDGEGKCKACKYFETGEEMTKCGVGKGMGHCAIFDFVCDENNGCMAWEAKGAEEMEEEDSEEYED